MDEIYLLKIQVEHNIKTTLVIIKDLNNRLNIIEDKLKEIDFRLQDAEDKLLEEVIHYEL